MGHQREKEKDEMVAPAMGLAEWAVAVVVVVMG